MSEREREKGKSHRRLFSSPEEMDQRMEEKKKVITYVRGRGRGRGGRAAVPITENGGIGFSLGFSIGLEVTMRGKDGGDDSGSHLERFGDVGGKVGGGCCISPCPGPAAVNLTEVFSLDGMEVEDKRYRKTEIAVNRGGDNGVLIFEAGGDSEGVDHFGGKISSLLLQENGSTGELGVETEEIYKEVTDFFEDGEAFPVSRKAAETANGGGKKVLAEIAAEEGDCRRAFPGEWSGN